MIHCTYMVLFSAFTSLMTFALALGSLRALSLRVKTVFSFGFSSSAGAAAGAAAAGAAEAEGMAMSWMFNRVWRKWESSGSIRTSTDERKEAERIS